MPGTFQVIRQTWYHSGNGHHGLLTDLTASRMPAEFQLILRVYCSETLLMIVKKYVPQPPAAAGMTKLKKAASMVVT